MFSMVHQKVPPLKPQTQRKKMTPSVQTRLRLFLRDLLLTTSVEYDLKELELETPREDLLNFFII